MPCCKRLLHAPQAAEEGRRSADRDARLARAEAAAAATAAEREHAAALHVQLEAELAVAHQERCARLFRVRVGLVLGPLTVQAHWALCACGRGHHAARAARHCRGRRWSAAPQGRVTGPAWIPRGALTGAGRARRERGAGATPFTPPAERRAVLSPARGHPPGSGGLRRRGAPSPRDAQALKRPLAVAAGVGASGLGPEPRGAPDAGRPRATGQPQPPPLPAAGAAEGAPATVWRRLWEGAGDALAVLLAPDPPARSVPILDEDRGGAGAAGAAERGGAHGVPAPDPAAPHPARPPQGPPPLGALRRRLRELAGGADASPALFVAAAAFLRRAVAEPEAAPPGAAAEQAADAARTRAQHPTLTLGGPRAVEAALELLRALLQHCPRSAALALASCGALGDGPAHEAPCPGGSPAGVGAAPSATGAGGGREHGAGPAAVPPGAARPAGLSWRVTLVGAGGGAVAAAPCALSVALDGAHGSPSAAQDGHAAALSRRAARRAACVAPRCAARAAPK